MSRKNLLIYFSLLFVSGLLVFIIVPLILQSGIIGITDLLYRLLYFGLASLLLIVVYHLRTGGSPRQLRAFWTITIAVMVAFPYALFGSLLFEGLLGISRVALFVPLYPIGLAIGVVIGHFVGSKMSKDDSDERNISLDLEA